MLVTTNKFFTELKQSAQFYISLNLQNVCISAIKLYNYEPMW